MGEDSQNPKLLRQFSAGGVVFKKENKRILWLITKSTPSDISPKAFWRLPKGWIDGEGDGPGPITRGQRKASEEELQSTALREVKEEGGVVANIISKVGTANFFFNFKGQRILKFVTFYLMEYLNDASDGHDWETQEVSWLPFDDAYSQLHFSHEKESLKKAKEILDSKT